ncbi:unnamed protein product [Paramecium sonneborni]|uniref:Uncharacterized protein n=1 Tax=Paramecium sonneborni TaxID=65129 RepID=A0A8S1LMD1_9CILI|nr:unnamed protein product [Paramecium sonneborni]
MKNDCQNISKVASDLIMAYKQLICQQNDTIISPRYEKTAFYLPSSPIEEQIDEENQLDTPRKKTIENENDYLIEISELRKIVEQMRMKYMNIPQKYLKQPLESNTQNNQNFIKTTTLNKRTKKHIVITKYQTDFLRQQYGKIQ